MKKAAQQNPIQLIILISFLFFLLPISCFSQQKAARSNIVKGKKIPQYKKQNRDAIAWIEDGNPNKAIAYFKEYLKNNPNDLESYYGLCVAFAKLGENEKAMQHMSIAVEKGLPVERFIAGPRHLLKNLHQDKRYQQYISEKNKLLIHGPLLGNFTANGASIWLRTAQEEDLKVEVYKEGVLVVSQVGQTQKEKDFTTILRVENLKASTDYRYRISANVNTLLSEGEFKTFPRENSPSKFVLGFAGGAGYTPMYERMWDTLSTHPFDVFLLLGDNVYIDHPTRPAVQDYCYYRRQSRPEFRRFTSQVPIYTIWDDHDFGENDCYGGTAINEYEWKIPVWEKFQNQWANPSYGGGERAPGVYYKMAIGDVDFFMLDCRFYRTNGKDDLHPDTMLGSVQQQWLYESLQKSEASFKVIGTSVPISTGTKEGKAGKDTWDGFAEEREELFSFIEEEGIEGVFFIAADRHRSDAWKTERTDGYPFYEFMSSRLTNIHTHPVMPKALFGYNKTPSFGQLSFDTKKSDPQVTYSIFNIENEEIHRMTLYRSELNLLRKKAEVKALAKAHSHNDYRHTRPLFDALENGFTSVEADILYKDNQLFVGHDKIELLKKNIPNLTKTYLQPLYDRFEKNNGEIYKNYAGDFYLWIDIKYAKEKVYPLLKEALWPYRKMLNYTHNGTTHEGKVTVILSGDRPFDLLLQDTLQLATLDGRLEDLDRGFHFTKVPFISENYKKIMSIDRSGRLSPNEMIKLKTFVNRCHQQGKKVRLWATPDKEELWGQLHKAGVDLINCDDLSKLRRYLQ